MSQLRTNSIVPVGGIPAGASGGGIIQVVQATKTDAFTTTSATFTDITGLSASITPRSASNKVLISLTVCIMGEGSATQAYVQLVRGSTPIAIGDAAGNRIRMTFQCIENQTNEVPTHSIMFLDSPATTSSTTYKATTRNQGSGNVFVNRSNLYTDSANSGTGICSIVLMEVSG